MAKTLKTGEHRRIPLFKGMASWIFLGNFTLDKRYNIRYN